MTQAVRRIMVVAVVPLARAAYLFAILALTTAASAETLIIDRAETAGLDGREWSKPFPSARTVDAMHRSVLLRFPGAAEAIASRVTMGSLLIRAEIALEFEATEISSNNYVVRNALGQEVWKANPPTWHLVPSVLRVPWRADAKLGPTYTDRIAGHMPWSALAAADNSADRFAAAFPAVELSARSPDARIDVSPILLTDQFAAEPRARWRLIDECGILLRKEEIYDSRYRSQSDPYEWAMPTGPLGLTFKAPRLILTFNDGEPSSTTRPQAVLELPPAFNEVAAATARVGATRQKPWTDPAWLASAGLSVRQILEQRPAWMSDDNYAHVREMLRIGGDQLSVGLSALAAGDAKPYQRMMEEFWLTPPRFWKGWGIQDDIMLSLMYSGAVPELIKQHHKRYWDAWLMPEVATRDLYHPQSKEAYEYAVRSGDWRGRASFFRSGYLYGPSTQNFNHTAVLGALLGGSIAGAKLAQADGRHGLEHLLLRFWGFLDGSTQEMLDHYYLSITLSGQKLLADAAPSSFDRLAARIVLERTLEMLTTIYQPAFRRLIAASGRARLSGVLVEQDGIYGALHAMSSNGTLKYLEGPFKAQVHGMPVWGYDFPPGRVALQSLAGPWAPAWFAHVVDDKPFPFSEISTDRVRNNFDPPLRRTTHLGRFYGLASQDLKGGSFDVLAQWARDERAAATLEGVGTMTFRTCVNACDMAATYGGAIPLTGQIATVQDKNRALVFMKPAGDRAAIEKAAGGRLERLASVAAVWNFTPQSRPEIHVDGQRIEESALPLVLREGQVLILRDGHSYIALRPLPVTDLGGGHVLVAKGRYGGKSEAGSAPIEPWITVASVNLERPASDAADSSMLAWERITREASGGFVIEMSDEAEYPSFGDFVRHVSETALEAHADAAQHSVDVRYRTGSDEVTARFATDVAPLAAHFPVKPGTHVRFISKRTVNGRPMDMPKGLERDTSWSQQGTTGRLEKNGVILETEPGRKAYLIVEPRGAGLLAYNPLPDPAQWALSLKDGSRLVANGRVGLLRVAIDQSQNSVQIEHQTQSAQQSSSLARTMSVTGFSQGTIFTVNGVLTKLVRDDSGNLKLRCEAGFPGGDF